MINLSGKVIFYFDTEEFGVEDLVSNLDDTNVRYITVTTEDGSEIKLSPTQLLLKGLVSFNDETEEEIEII